jgi:hypothetical protein
MTQVFRTEEELQKSLPQISPIIPYIESEEVIIVNLQYKLLEKYRLYFSKENRAELFNISRFNQYKEVLESRINFEKFLPTTFTRRQSIFRCWKNVEELFFRPKTVLVYNEDKLQEIRYVPIKCSVIETSLFDKMINNTKWAIEYKFEVLNEYDVDNEY